MKRLLKAALIAFAVSAACIIPPVLHFITGPLGPLIGGVVGGSKSQAKPKEVVVIGALMGFMLLALVLIIVELISMSQSSVFDVLKKFTATGSDLFQVSAIVFLYVFFTGTFGALIGGRMANSNTTEEEK